MLLVVCATVPEMRAALGGMFDLRGMTPGIPLALGDDLRALVCGVGPVSAGFALGRAVGLLKPQGLRGVLSLGVGGSYDLAKLPLGATVVAASERWPEYGLATKRGVEPRGLPFPLAKGPEGEVYDVMELEPTAQAARIGVELPGEWPEAACLTVSSASGDDVIANQRRAFGAGVENMEGFALALGCRLVRVPFVEVRTVSNNVGDRPPVNWDLNGALDALGQAAGSLLNNLQSHGR